MPGFINKSKLDELKQENYAKTLSAQIVELHRLVNETVENHFEQIAEQGRKIENTWQLMDEKEIRLLDKINECIERNDSLRYDFKSMLKLSLVLHAITIIGLGLVVFFA